VTGNPREQHSTKETRIEPAWTEALRRYDAAKMRAKGLEPEPTLAELAKQWVAAHRLLLSPSHVDSVARIGERHLYGLQDTLISKINTGMVEGARLEYLKTHEKSSANHWLACMRLLYGWAIRRGMIRFRPWDVRKLKVQQKPKVLLPVDKAADWMGEVDALSEHEPAIGLAIRLMIGLGLRCESEALNARWEWLDIDRRIYTPGETKGREAWARPVPEWILEILRPFKQSWGLIVPTQAGKVLTSCRIQRVMDLACEAVDIPRLTPHKLRHTYATLLAEEGVPIQDIQVALGHKDIRTTLAYLGVDIRRVAQGQAKMAARLNISGAKLAHTMVQTHGGTKCAV
jgi:integrase